MLPKLGILAGNGQLPVMIIDACNASGRPFFVIAFEGQTPEQTVANSPHAWVRLGAGGESLRHLRTQGVEELVLAGGIRKPGLLQLRPDWWGIKFILKARNYGAGDDGLLQALIRTLEFEEGFRIVSPDGLVDDLLAKSGFVTAAEIDLAPHREDINLAVEAALDVGRRDEGQAAVVRNGRILGIEDKEGTDALLRRLVDVESTGRGVTRTGVLAKVAKPGQETRVDLPTIGSETVTMAAAAGLAGIVIEASRSLIIDRALVQQQADAAGLFIHAMELDEIQVGEQEIASRDKATDQLAPMVFLVAGEPSGDQLGAALIRGLRQKLPGIQLAGVGGEIMEQEGLVSLFPMEELSVMGVAEVFPRLPNILKRIRQTARAAIASNPRVVVTIDSPDFCFRVAKRLMGRGIPLVHYVAPSVWAWRPGRARKIAAFLDHLLAILPFEPAYFESVGLPCTFVGHPIVEKTGVGDGHSFRQRHGLSVDTQVIGIFPGSRKGEVGRLLPIFLDAIKQVPMSGASMHLVFPTVEITDALVRAAVRDLPVPMTIVSDDRDKLDALASCNVAIAASGTVALELAKARVPAVIAYRLNPLTAFIARRLVTVPFASLVNLLEERAVTPEMLQENCTPENISNALADLLGSHKLRIDQISGYNSALKKLTISNESGVNAAAEAVLRVMRS